MRSTHTGVEWEANAPAWIELSRADADRSRDLVNTPAFLDAMPGATGRDVLDLGCGEGHNTRPLCERGTRLTALDVSETIVRRAQDAGGSIEQVVEPVATEEFANRHPELADTCIVPFFLIVRARRSRGLLAS